MVTLPGPIGDVVPPDIADPPSLASLGAHALGQLLARADRQADCESGIDNVDPTGGAVCNIYDEPPLTANIEHFGTLGVAVESYRESDRL